jgi:hypothetical protein
MECGPKPAGDYRIVMIGSSTALGFGVSRERTFAALLPTELSKQSGNKVELYNESLTWTNPHSISLHFNDILAAHPDMVLWIIAPGDVANTRLIPDLGERNDARADKETVSLLAKVWRHMKEVGAGGSIKDMAVTFWNDHSTSIMVEHFLYESQILYVESYLRKGDGEASFLRAEPNADWQNYLESFDGYAKDIEAQAKAAGVPLVAVLVPYRAQAAMISMGEWPVGYNPYKLDNELHSIIVSHGGIYLDILPDFRTIPNPERYYFPVNGHPNQEGQAIISQLLAKELTSGAVPALELAPPSQTGTAQGR